MPASSRIPCSWYQYREPGAARSARVYVTAGDPPLWHGDDVAAALGVMPVFDHWTNLPGWEDDEGELVPFLTTDQVRALAADVPPFLEFVEETLACMRAGLADRAPSSPTSSTPRPRTRVPPRGSLPFARRSSPAPMPDPRPS